MRFELKNGDMSAVFESLGAEPVSVKYRGKERLWQNENGSWAGHAPVLFPVCGNCALRLHGVRYPLPLRHGFARRKEFSVAEIGESRIVFALKEDEDTLRQYPFGFCLTVCYTLGQNTLGIEYGLKNTGKEPLCFSWGGHLSHALFSPFEGHFLRFSEEEIFDRLLHDGEGLLTGKRERMGRGRTLAFTEELLGGDTVILTPRSRSVALENGSGRVAALSFEGFDYLLLWRPEGANMLCIEPWKNLPDRQNDMREFPEKEGVETLNAGEHAEATQIITYSEV